MWLILALGAALAGPPGQAMGPPDAHVCDGSTVLDYRDFSAAYAAAGQTCQAGAGLPAEPFTGELRCLNGLALAYDQPTRRFHMTGAGCDPPAPTTARRTAPPSVPERGRGELPLTRAN